MLLDFGLSSGLAYKHNFQQDIANAQRNEMLDRQARIDAETKTRLFADEFKFGEATTDYNKQQLKAYTEKLIPEIGKFVNDNPDYRTNTMKYALYKQMTGQLLKNKWVDNDMKFQGMQKEYAKHLAEHPEDVNLPEIQAMASQIEKYKRTGDVLGEIGKDRQFNFSTPAPMLDTEKIISDRGSKLTQSGFDTTPYGNIEYATNLDAQTAAKQLLGDPAFSRSVQLKMRSSGVKANPVDYVTEGLLAYSKKNRNVNFGKQNILLQHSLKDDEISGVDPMQRIIDEAKKSSDRTAPILPSFVKKLHNSDNGLPIMTDAIYEDMGGNPTSLDLGQVTGAPTGRFKDFGQNGGAAEYSVILPVEEAETILGDVIEDPIFGDAEIAKQHTDKFKMEEHYNKNTKKNEQFVRFNVYKPIEVDENTKNLARGFYPKKNEVKGKEVNVPAGTPLSSDGKWYYNGQKWISTGK